MESGQDVKSLAKSSRYRSGYGYDAHRLVPGRPLILGGEEIPHEKGLQGHSDADVLTHALCDAMLGAAGAGDIGGHFPDTDRKFKDISSLKILGSVAELVSEKGYLAAACAVNPDVINLKATTTEERGFEGRGEGMSAHAVVMLRKK
ncbi:MAG: 2-C-methyl-D-erythritol 2,4-cyclodiphosphate synthase [Desulfobulbaceae bacterium]